MQKLICCLTLLLIIGTSVKAQFQLRRIDSLYLMTPNPCPGDSVSVIGEFACNTGGISDIGTNVVQNGNFFLASEVVCQGLLQVITGWRDTFHLGVLPQGSYTLKCDFYTADANFYCQTATLWDSMSIAFNVGPPTAVIQANVPGSTVTICQGGSAPLQGNSGVNLNYQWLMNGTPIPGANQPSYTATQAGAYQLIVDRCNFPDTSNTINVVISIPQVNLSLPGPACDDAPGYPLSGGSPPGGSWFGPFVSGSNFDCLGAPVGAYPVTYTYTDNFNCTGQATDTLQVIPSPQVSLNPLPASCETDPPFTLTGGQPSGGAYSGPGVSNGVFNPSAAGPGIHIITYTYVDANLCSNSASQPLAVNAAPATPTITQIGDTLFSSAPSGNQWYNQAGPIPGATGNYYIPTVSGTYHVVTTDGIGCGSRPSNTIAVTVAVAIEESFADQWKAIWLANSGAIQIKGQSDTELKLILSDLQGRILIRRAARTDVEGNTRMHAGELSVGMYMLQLRTETGSMVQRLMVW